MTPWGRFRRRGEKTRLREIEQARRLQSIAQLARGVAHDFNNLLGIVSTYADFIRESDAAPEIRADANRIKEAALRGSALARQLQTFGQGADGEKPQPLLVRTVVAGMVDMLHGALGSVRLQLRMDEPPPWVVVIDRSHLEQLIMNLVLNARDAIGQAGGTVQVDVSKVVADGAYADAHPGVRPGGRYVRMMVLDDGPGIDDEVARHAFDPFFTTKGTGVGLGLATAHGVVTRQGGAISIRSRPERGTVVTIHFVAEPAPRPPPPPPPIEQAEPLTVLLAEDEAAARDMVMRILTTAGYVVLPAADGEEALRVAEAADGHIDLLLTDVVMPRLRGPQLADRVRGLCPATAVVYMSGHATGGYGLDDPVIQKPFNRDALLEVVRESFA